MQNTSNQPLGSQDFPAWKIIEDMERSTIPPFPVPVLAQEVAAAQRGGDA